MNNKIHKLNVVYDTEAAFQADLSAEKIYAASLVYIREKNALWRGGSYIINVAEQVAALRELVMAYTDQIFESLENRLVHDFGTYADLDALRAAHPTANAGDMALVGSTDTVWVWSEAKQDWVDTDKKGEVTDAQFQAHVTNSGAHVTGQFHPATGHRHNGADSPRVAYSDLEGAPVAVNPNINATVSNSVGTPAVSVTGAYPDLTLAFSNLKGTAGTSVTCIQSASESAAQSASAAAPNNIYYTV
ncbi:hypothetical protein FACS189464_1870 [Bacteroidia bacterium]|nr:hypothetical protein FACS189464_1870 [Bacteroidia bacterium]